MENIGNVISVLSLDWKNGLLGIAAIIIVAVWVIQKWEFLMEKFGIQTRRMRKDTQQEKDIAELKNYNTQTDQKIDKIFECMDDMKTTVGELSQRVKELDKKNDVNEAARLKDRIAQGYRYFSERGEWSSMDKESMEDLIRAYSQYSENSFVHSVVEKEMYKWHIIDE